MSVTRIESSAFEQATLKSESYRIIGLLALLGALMLYSAARGLALGQTRLMAAQTLLLALALAYEAYMLKAVKKAIAEGREIPSSVWVLNVFIETQIPTLAIFFLIRSQLLSPYLLLVAPAMLVYFFFIILSTLRLSPALSLLTGLLSAAGYFAVASYTAVSYPSPAANPVIFPLKLYLIYSGLILASGLIAAFVAGQIKGHVAAALREAELQGELELVRHDLETARTIQQALLPAQLPGLEGFDITGWNQPADQTGGDYFDWLALPDGKIAVSLGDATGHGIGPALVSTLCRAYARACVLTTDDRDGGGGLLERLNRLLSEDLEANRFVTFAVIFLDPDSSQFKVLSAGHGPILWYQRATDKMENLEAQGIPLGMIAGVAYSQGMEGVLAEGDFLALVTDGFYEWENPEGEQIGVPRLETVLRESRDLSAEEMVSRMRDAVASFCRGTKQMDDLTAVVLKRQVKTANVKLSTDFGKPEILPAIIDEKQRETPAVPVRV